MDCSRRSPDARSPGHGRERIFRPKSFSLGVIDVFHVAAIYMPYVLVVLLGFAIYCLLPPIALPQPEAIVEAVATARATGTLGLAPFLSRTLAQVLSATDHVRQVWYAYAIIAFCVYYVVSTKPPVYLMDFAVYEPPESWQTSRADLIEIMRRLNCFTPESISFMAKLLDKSGTGDYTHWPPGTTRILRDTTLSPDRSLAAARLVAETVLCSCFEQVLARTGVKAKDVDFVVVNCSLFCPTPSLAAIVAQRFQLKSTARTYSLGGMGCSASVVSIDLAKQLLQNRSNSIAVVLSTEEISQQLYLGNERSMLVQNTLFRVGGAAILLSNKTIDGFRAKYKLLQTVRVQDNSDVAHHVVYQCEDPTGLKGIALGKEITKVAGKALLANLTILGPSVLPISEQVKTVASLVRRGVVKAVNEFADKYSLGPLPGSVSGAVDAGAAAAASAGGGAAGERSLSAPRAGRYAKPAPYVPDFKRGLNHFCIHAGGRAVIDGIEQNLNLERWHTAPSRATLYHWGNTSSSSIWYELRYCEGENDRDWGKGGSVAGTGGGSSGAPVVRAPRGRSGSSSSGSGAPVPGAAQGGAAASPPPGGAGAMPVAPAAGPDPDAEAAANGWDPKRKWALPEYRGRTIRPGERVLQLAFGSGFKCGSALWIRLR